MEVTDNVASLFLSLAGYSTDPIPTAAWPFRGKNPCKPIMAVTNSNLASNDGINEEDEHTSPNTPCRLPKFFMIYS